MQGLISICTHSELSVEGGGRGEFGMMEKEDGWEKRVLTVEREVVGMSEVGRKRKGRGGVETVKGTNSATKVLDGAKDESGNVR